MCNVCASLMSKHISDKLPTLFYLLEKIIIYYINKLLKEVKL